MIGLKNWQNHMSFPRRREPMFGVATKRGMDSRLRGNDNVDRGRMTIASAKDDTLLRNRPIFLFDTFSALRAECCANFIHNCIPELNNPHPQRCAQPPSRQRRNRPSFYRDHSLCPNSIHNPLGEGYRVERFESEDFRNRYHSLRQVILSASEESYLSHRPTPEPKPRS
jgi:hypothetical protein